MLSRSTIWMLVGTTLGLPILLISHPLKVLGSELFYLNFAAVVICFLVGIILSVAERGEDRES